MEVLEIWSHVSPSDTLVHNPVRLSQRDSLHGAGDLDRFDGREPIESQPKQRRIPIVDEQSHEPTLRPRGSPRSEVAFKRNSWLTYIMATKTTARARSSVATAADLSDALTSASSTDGSVAISVDDRTVILPAQLVTALVELLDDIGEGRAVTSAPAGLPLGTEVASELLGVSRPWLTTLLDRGDIPSSRVGTKRRIRLGDLLAYRRSDHSRRREALTWEFLDKE